MMEAKSRLKDLDRIDRNILNELQKDGRISNVELSKRVGLSPTPCLERVRRLERQGYIEGYAAILNPHYLDASLLVFVEITLNRGAPDVFEQFNKAVQVLEEIQECHLVSGDFDYLLKTRVSDMSALPPPAGGNPAASARRQRHPHLRGDGRGQTEQSAGDQHPLSWVMLWLASLATSHDIQKRAAGPLVSSYRAGCEYGRHIGHWLTTGGLFRDTRPPYPPALHVFRKEPEFGR